jgi:hypothetical protein
MVPLEAIRYEKMEPGEAFDPATVFEEKSLGAEPTGG